MAEGLRLYHSPWDVIDFQANAVARLYLLNRRLILWDTGLGKGHLAMAGSAMLFEDDKIAQTVIIAEQTKLSEWVEDFQTFTNLDVGLYYGTKRHKLRDSGDMPSVIVTTYETLRNDASIAQKVGKRNQTKNIPGPLTQHLTDLMSQSGRGALVVYDEISKLRNRANNTYKVHERFMRWLEKVHGRDGLWVAGLTATPIEGFPDNFFNTWRLVDKTYAPKVEEFEVAHVRYRDPWGRAEYMDLGEGDDFITGAPLFTSKIEYLVDRKRKTDPDVRDRFPRMTEDFAPVDMTPAQKALYEAVERLLDIQEQEGRSYVEEAAIFTVMRQLVGHPEALLASQAETSKFLVQLLGEEALRSAGSGKLDRLISYLQPIMDQGDQAVVYSFFGRSIIPLLARELERHDIKSFAVHTGAMSNPQKDAARRSFRSGEKRILLSSDAGSKGINLPEASYIICFELPLLYSTYYQRISRASRLGATTTDRLVTAKSFVVPHTVEGSIAGTVYQRNQWHDMIVDADGQPDPSHMKASDRIVLHQIASAKKPTKE